MIIFKDFCNAKKTNKNKHKVEVILITFQIHPSLSYQHVKFIIRFKVYFQSFIIFALIILF